jgi:carbon storage regulator
MLVLSRKQGDSIVIGDCISITVTRITGGRVRLGITAPKHITVDRGEVYRRIGTEHDRDTSLVAMSR